MNFDNCNYVVSNAGSLIRSLLNQSQQASTHNNSDGYTSVTSDDLMGREQNQNSLGDGGIIETIMMIIGFAIVFSLLNSYINNRRNKLNQKHTSNNNNDDVNNNDRDNSPVM